MKSSNGQSRINVYALWGVGHASAIEGASEPELAAKRIDALIKALLTRMKLVVITLGEGDDAQVIFETLNSRAEPLLAMDLVRNSIFHRAESQGASVDALYAELWQPFETSFWKADAPRARPVRPRIEHFLAHSLTAQTGVGTSMRELYAEYRAFTKPKGKERFKNVSDELMALTRFMDAYQTLEGQKLEGGKVTDDDLARFGRKLAAWETTTVYPAVFQIATAPIDPAECKAILDLLYSYIVRRSVCELGAKNLNNVFQRLATLFLRDGVSLAIATVALLEPVGPAGRFPTDVDFRGAIIDNPLYGRLTSSRLADFLWEIEFASRTGFMEKIERPAGLWIEHVLPQSWDLKWPLPGNAEVAPETVRVNRDRIINTLGNLTLVTDSLNISLGNKDFTAKRVKLRGNTLLAMNQWICDQDTWGEKEIAERAVRIANLAVSIWRRPA